MKYIFHYIFVVILHIAIVFLGVFSIFISIWYWDGKYISFLDNACDEFIKKLKEER